MNQRKTQNAIVGTVVLVALFTLIFGMAFLNEYAPGKSTDAYILEVPEVGLLAKDDPVKFNGVKVGKVKNIALENGQVRVTIEVVGENKIPKGSKVQIQNIGLMGERMINVSLSSNREFWEPGAVIPAGYDYGIAETMGVAGQLVVQAKAMVEQLQVVVDSTVGRTDFVPRLNNVVRRADEVSARLEKMVADLDPKLRGTVADVSAAGKGARGLIDRSAPAVERVVQRADVASGELQALLDDLKSTTVDIRVLVAKARDGKSTLGHLANDDEFYFQLRSSVVRADSLLNRIQRKGLDINVDLW